MGRAGSFQLIRLFGIRVGVDASWFLILFIALYFLQGQFKETVRGSESAAYATAVAAAFLFFGSIILHEVGHALAARREGIHVAGIDLFFFGGLMRMSQDPATPGAEFRVAAAGPLVTLLIVAAGTGLGVLLQGWTGFWELALLSDEQVSAPLLLLAFIVPMNVALLIFNLVPALPLDGGRMARAAVWKLTGDRRKSTRVAAGMGRAFGWLLIVWGVFLAIRSSPFTGVYLAFLGWLINQSARGAVAQSAVTERLEGITVSDVMDAEPVTIPADAATRDAYEQYFLRYHGWDWFAVVDADGRYIGRADRAAVQAAAYEPDGDLPVRLVTPADEEGRVRADAPLEALLGSDALRRLGALMAVDDQDRLRGVVTLEQVHRALRSSLAPG